MLFNAVGVGRRIVSPGGSRSRVAAEGRTTSCAAATASSLGRKPKVSRLTHRTAAATKSVARWTSRHTPTLPRPKSAAPGLLAAQTILQAFRFEFIGGRQLPSWSRRAVRGRELRLKGERPAAQQRQQDRGREVRLSRTPLPPNRAGGSPAHGSPVSSCLQGIAQNGCGPLADSRDLPP